MKILSTYAYDVEDQAGNKLVVVDDTDFDHVAHHINESFQFKQKAATNMKEQVEEIIKAQASLLPYASIAINAEQFPEIAERINAIYEQQDAWSRIFLLEDGDSKKVGEDVFTFEDIKYIEESGYENYLQYKIAVMQWALQGGEVEMVSDISLVWLTSEPVFSWSNDPNYFRAVPKQQKPEYRPYTFEEFCTMQMMGKVLTEKNTQSICYISDYQPGVERVEITYNRKIITCNFNELLKQFTWLDGSPCGELCDE